MLPLRIRVDLEAITTKRYSISQSSNIRLFSIISRTLVGGFLPLCRDTVCVFCSPSGLGHTHSLGVSYLSAEMQLTGPWRENNCIHSFFKGISAMWSANSLCKDLNSGHDVHFPQWRLLYHEHISLSLSLSLSLSQSLSLSLFLYIYIYIYMYIYIYIYEFFCL